MKDPGARSLKPGAKLPCLVAATLAVAATLSAQAPSTESRTRQHVTTLASDRLEGRLAGSAGEKLASDYLAAELRRIGAQPLPGRSDFLLPFEFTAGTRDGGSSISVTTPAPPGQRRFALAGREIQALS